MRKWRQSIRNREALAIRADINILELLCDAPPPNEIRGEIGIVYVRGPIDHHRSFGDSYERFAEAFHELNDNDQVKAIAMCVDSPGGLVSGLNATVRTLRKAKRKPVYAIVDEMATSAAYALSCIADEIIASPSAVTGSVGVISTMCSQARADERQGFDFVTITSGERKADGHPHMPIEPGAIEAEEKRVDDLAMQFFKLVDEARGLSPDYLRALEAGIFLGAEALEMGLVDAVLDAEEAIQAIADAHGLVAQLDTHGASVSSETPEASMLTAKAQIASLTRKMAASVSKKERAALANQITALLAKLPARAAMKKTSYRLEEEETVEDEDEEEEGGNETDREEEGDDDEKKASAAEEEEASAESDDDEKKAEDDKEPPGDDKKESKKASARLAALEAEVTRLRADAAKREARDARTVLGTTLATALRDKRITPAEHATLMKKDAEYVAHFLDARPKSIVLTPEEALRPLPKGSANVARQSGGVPEAAIELTPEMEDMLAKIPDEKLRAQVLANWKAQTNGVSR
jgi:signal peptide peptidase SppA